ncbi:hypothetical protein [uncultured Thiohalocapsa sp.]|uniref:hypothetical protein n=1 Tax=uncultured Thiohalocapsa sp. TaxID=768990 RepID=UPI0025D98126|nr:hypothetical protein [uncultured Thiohalocapsa sp.]
MAKKHKKRSGRGTPKSAQQAQQASPEVRARAAQDALAQGRFRDAVGGFKALLKEDAASEHTPARRLALAEAYAGRARELTAKGMHKEALAIWDNRAALGPEVPPAPEHAALKLRLGDPGPLLALWARADALPRDEREQIGTWLAAAALADAAPGLQGLAADDPLRRHAEPARAALDAYCAGDDAALESALAGIPFRSPYRDLALLLKALSRLEAEPATSRDLLARIGAASAFAPLRQAAEAALLSDADCLDALHRLGPRQAQLAAALRGWSAEQLALAREVAAMDAPLDAPADADARKALLRLLERHRELLGRDWAARAARRLSASLPGAGGGRHAPASRARDLIEDTLSEALAAAHAAEADGHPWNVLNAWDDVAEVLRVAAEAEPTDPDRPVAIALALRRADQYFDLLGVDVPDTEPDSEQSVAAEQLARSLEWDPEHRDTYLRLIGWYRRGARLKDARRVLAAAQARWPRDMAVLEAALDTALAGDAFKKAAGIARQMLDIDPINSGARRRLVDAHIAHAAKQLGKDRPDLASKELHQARQWTQRGAGLQTLRERLDFMQALARLHVVGVDAGRKRVQELLEQCGPGPVAQLELALAAELLLFDQVKLFELLDLPKVKLQAPGDLRLILTRLREFAERRKRYAVSLVDWLKTLLQGAPWKQLDAEALELACETLRRMRLSAPRREAAGAALKCWAGTPAFVFHALESKYDESGSPGAADRVKLEQALERAERDGDARTVSRLLSLRETFWPFSGFPPSGFDHLLDDAGDDEPFDLPDPRLDPGADEVAANLLDKLDRLPLRQALEACGIPKSLRKRLLKLARDEGEAFVREQLKQLLRDTEASFHAEDAPTEARGRRSGRQPDDDHPEQLDLF